MLRAACPPSRLSAARRPLGWLAAQSQPVGQRASQPAGQLPGARPSFVAALTAAMSASSGSSSSSSSSKGAQLTALARLPQQRDKLRPPSLGWRRPTIVGAAARRSSAPAYRQPLAPATPKLAHLAAAAAAAAAAQSLAIICPIRQILTGGSISHPPITALTFQGRTCLH
mgnify:CR=1 FL=1